MKFVDVTNDIAFRKIFGSETKKKALISFLNAVIELPQNSRVADVEIINPYQLPKLSGGKSTIIDVKAKDQQGNVFIVEMQVAEIEFFHKRILYYTSQSYVSQIGQGADYNRLKPVYFIGILEFEIGNNPSYFSRHKVLDVETGENVVRDVVFHFIELPKFSKTSSELQTQVDQWTYFIKNAQDLQVIPDTINDEGLLEAYTEADRHNWTNLEWEDYQRASIKERDEIGRVELATRRAEEKGLERGMKKGLERGLEQGLEQGLQRGLEQGLEQGQAIGEKNKVVKIAKQAKAMGLPIADIVKLTGLTEAEINDLSV